MKYQRPSDHKRVKCCRICNYLKWSKYGEGWFFDYSKGKFTKEEFNSKFSVLKRVLR